MEVVAGVDLGGTAINYTLITRDEKFLIEGLCEHPALSTQGPEVCLQQIENGLKIAAELAHCALDRHCGRWLGYAWSRQRGGHAEREGFDELRASELGGF